MWQIHSSYWWRELFSNRTFLLKIWFYNLTLQVAERKGNWWMLLFPSIFKFNEFHSIWRSNTFYLVCYMYVLHVHISSLLALLKSGTTKYFISNLISTAGIQSLTMQWTCLNSSWNYMNATKILIAFPLKILLHLKWRISYLI